MLVRTQSLAAFACMSKACAPPPVGRGGSLRGPSAPSAMVVFDDAVADAARVARNDYEMSSAEMKVKANERVVSRMLLGGRMSKWLGENGDKLTSPLLANLMAKRFDDSYIVAMPKGEAIFRKLIDAARKASGSAAAGVIHDMEKALAGEEDEDFNYGRTVRGLMTKSNLLDVVNAVSDGDAEMSLTTLFVRDVIDSWARSASWSVISDESYLSADRVHKVPDAVTAFKKFKEDSLRRIEATQADSDLMDIYTRSEYEATQDWLKENGIDSVTVSRGVVVDNGSVDFKQDDTVDIQMNPLSSWSYNLTQAARFARGSGSGATGVVVQSVIPASSIQSTAFSGRGCLAEDEMILIGYGGQALVALMYE